MGPWACEVPTELTTATLSPTCLTLRHVISHAVVSVWQGGFATSFGTSQ